MHFHEELLVNLLHDLCQPLGNIETSAYCLDRCIGHDPARAQEYLRLIQQQVEQATAMLAAAAAELAQARRQGAEPVVAFEMAAAASH